MSIFRKKHIFHNIKLDIALAIPALIKKEKQTILQDLVNDGPASQMVAQLQVNIGLYLVFVGFLQTRLLTKLSF